MDFSDEECSICLESLENAVVTPCGHLFCKGCIERHISSDSLNKSCPICRDPITLDTLIPIPKSSKEEQQPITSEKSNSVPVQSTKINALMEELNSLPKDDGAKSIVFSQWTSMLDLLETPLRDAGIQFVRLDGSMNHQLRDRSVQRFKEDPNITVFLISMKAGGLGLNLVAASNVYLLDPWWNPATEDQAIDRVHRLGQCRPVHVVRFIIKGTIEERILELQNRKKILAQGALGANGKESRQIRVNELRLLFQD